MDVGDSEMARNDKGNTKVASDRQVWRDPSHIIFKVLRHKLQTQDDMEDEERMQEDNRPAKSTKQRSKKRAKAPTTAEAPAGKDKVCIHGLSSTRCSR